MTQGVSQGLKIAGGVVGLAVLAIVWLGANHVREARAMTRLAAQRHPFAPTDTASMGRMPAVLRESSGLAISRTYPGVYWTHNDSGDRPHLYAINATATLLAIFDVEGAEAVDWEAMALGRCPGTGGTSCLYVADIGDNGVNRELVTIYVVEEPDPSVGDGTVALLGTVSFVYPDGPHNAEALAITADADLVVITKERSRTTWLFEILAGDVGTAVVDGGMLTLGAGRRLPIRPDPVVGRLVTGAALNPDGDTLAVRTYSEIYFFRWPVSDPPELAADVCFLGELEPQGEAVAFDEDGRLTLTSESRVQEPGYLRTVRCAGVGS